ncbi:MAG: TonB-dependent receptor [Rhodothermales bacterium]|nr:TonB-dependent receptor [Rhodothermales bacterium]
MTDRATRFLTFILLLLPAAPVAGQDLYGRITTTDGSPLPGAQIVAEELQRGAVADGEGRYRLSHLPPGDHPISVRFVGFATVREFVRIDSVDVRLDVTLEEAAIELDETVISADSRADLRLKASSRSVTVLDPEDLQAIRGQTLGETLKELPGISSLSTGPSISKPVIRGLHSQRIVLLNAGVPQEGQQWGGEHAPEIDPFSSSRIEVIRGAAGVEYGIGAIGGVIRVEPQDLPYSGSPSGRLFVNGYSNNAQAAGSLMLQDAVDAVPGLAWRAQASARRAGDSRAPDDVIGNSAFRETDAALTAGFDRDRYHVRLHASHFGTTLGLFSGAHIGNVDDLLRAIERGSPLVDYEFGFEIDAPKQKIDHDLVSVDLGMLLGSGDRIELQYGFQSNRRKEFDAHSRFGEPSSDPAFSLDLVTHSVDASVVWRPRGNRTGSVGLSGMTQSNVNGESGFLIPNFRANTAGAFVRETWVLGALTVDSGLRYDVRHLTAWPRENLSSGEFVRRTHAWSSLSGVVGVMWRFVESWSIASNFGVAWRPPGVNELYNFGVHHGTAQFEIGDPDLGGERSWNVDATLRHVSDRGSLELSVFNNVMDGFIHLFPGEEPRVTIRGTFPEFLYRQSNAVLRGVDGGFETDILPGRLTLGGSASVVRGTDTDRNVPLIAMPADRVSGSVTLHLPDALGLTDSSIGGEVRRVARQSRVEPDVDFSKPPPGYTLIGLRVDTRIPWPSSRIDASVEIDNLFNVRYRDYLSRFRYFIDDPGRNLIVRLTIPFGAESTS